MVLKIFRKELKMLDFLENLEILGKLRVMISKYEANYDAGRGIFVQNTIISPDLPFFFPYLMQKHHFYHLHPLCGKTLPNSVLKLPN